MSLRIRRGTEAQRTGVTFDTGELVYTTDNKQLWIGDGITAGGTPVVGSNITGYGLTFNTSSKRIEVAGLTADDVVGGVNNKYFSTELAQDAVAPMFTSVSATHTNISFQYDDSLGVINATVTLDGIGLTDIIADTSPQLGGDLDLNSSDITGTGNIDITGNVTLTSGNVTLSGQLDANTVVASTVDADTFTVGVTVNSNSISTLPGSLDGFAVLTPTGFEMAIKAHRGTNASPQTTVAGDIIGAFTIKGFDGNVYHAAGAFSAQYDETATVTDVYPKSNVAIIAGAGGENVVLASLSGVTGVFTVPVINSASYTSSTLPLASVVGPGARAFVTDATSTSFGSAYAGGSTSAVPVWSNGTSWFIG